MQKNKKAHPKGRCLARNIFTQTAPNSARLQAGKAASPGLVLLTVPSAPQDYWLSLLYKRLIGPKVLAIHVAGLQRKPRPGRVIRDKLRIYAHCTSYHK